jgi:hypothetical protein
MKFLNSPIHALEFPDASRTLVNELLVEAKVTLRENALSTASITIDNESDTYPYEVAAGSNIELFVGEDEDNLTDMFNGWVNFPAATIGKNKRALLECDHIGFSLAEMLVAQEYGAQSSNPTLDTITEILTDASYGIVPKYVNKILGTATDSGYSLSTAGTIDTITGSINYIDFPFKPADKSLNDLCDILTALKAGSAGPHWIVDNNGNLRVKLVTSNQAYVSETNRGWTKYYGGADNTAGQANLTLGEDINLVDLEEQAAEGNYIVYHGNWRKPSNGDAWTDADVSGWGTSGSISLASNSTDFVVGSASLEATCGDVDTSWFYYPTTKDAGWDFTKIGDPTHVPTLSFSAKRLGVNDGRWISIYTDDTHFTVLRLNSTTVNFPLDDDRWYKIDVPIGPYWQLKESWSDMYWSSTDNIDWSNINWIEFGINGAANNRFLVDGLHFGNVPICRTAWNSALPSNSKCKMRLITDSVGKDDSLIASDDSGLIAQLAHAELLRQQKATNHITVKLPIIPDALPGQWFSLEGFDYRATKIVHEIKSNDYTTTLYLTDDLTNSKNRPRWEDVNRQYANIRPEFQDRQASNLKAGSIDWRIQKLVKDYAP